MAKRDAGSKPISHWALAVVAGSTLVLGSAFGFVLVGLAGAGSTTDTYFASVLVPQFVATVASAPVANVVVPLIAVLPDDRARRAGWQAVGIVSAITACVALLLHLGARPLSALLFPGFDEAALDEVTRLMRWQLPFLPAAPAALVAWSVAQARGAYLGSELSNAVPAGLALLALVAFFDTGGVLTAAVAFSARPLLQLVYLLPWLGRPRFEREAEFLGPLWRRGRVVLTGSAIARLDGIADRYLSSMAPPGELTMFVLAHRAYIALTGVVARAWVTPLLPDMSRRLGEGRVETSRRMARSRAGRLSLIGLGGYGLAALLGALLLLLPADTELGRIWPMVYPIALALVGMLAIPIALLLNQYFHASGRPEVPTRISVVGVFLGIAAKYVGFRTGGVVGLALGTSFMYLFNLGGVAVAYRRDAPQEAPS